MTIEFTMTELTELTPRITVFGVGGAGGNAVNNMINTGLEGVDFVVANTDAQALAYSKAEKKIQLGASLTQGLGAGARPEVGRAAAEETIELIREHLRGSHMVFITAGMGGGTGTGAAPIIAKTAREEGILTVGVITKPFQFEGNRRMLLADEGIKELSQYVDTLIIIPNQNLFRIANERTTFADAFAMADEVLHSGVRGITDLMVLPGLVNLDFADVRTVMSEMGKAMMGTGEAEGENRALEAAEAAISNPLLDEVSMKGANGVLINITGGMDLTLFEVDEAANRIRSEVNPEANILVGSALNPDLNGKMRVSVVATGIESGSNIGMEPRKTYRFETKSEIVTKQKSEEPSDGGYESVEGSQTDINPTMSDDDLETTLILTDEVQEEDAIIKTDVTISDIQRETEHLLAQLADGIVQREENSEIKTDVPELTASRREPFIAAAPVMPEKRMEPLIDRADPFAEAAMMNGSKEDKVPERKGLMGFFGNRRKAALKKQPVSLQADLLSPEMNEPVIRQNPMLNNGRENDNKDNIAEQPIEAVRDETPKLSAQKEDDHLEIPAFLRRQAN
ncbi:MAG: cell division protein FtsZ [Emcibacter sp.]|nr:cell division protein FtsZ [Emcibacter sp.]